MDPKEVYKKIVTGGVESHIEEFFTEEEKEKFFPKNKKIFELGSGCGKTAEIFTKYDNAVTCSDVSEASVERLKSYKTFANVLYLDISTEKIPIEDEYFDVCCAFEVFEHISNLYTAINELKRICKIDGYFFISIPDEKQQFGYAGHRHAFIFPGLFQPDNFKIFLKQMYLKIELYKEIYFKHTYVKMLDGSNECPKHHLFICKNKAIIVDILKVVAENYDENYLYSNLN